MTKCVDLREQKSFFQICSICDREEILHIFEIENSFTFSNKNHIFSHALIIDNQHFKKFITTQKLLFIINYNILLY